MTEETAHNRNTASAVADFSDCCLGSPDDPTGQIYDARSWKRATAIGRFGSDWGLSFAEIKCRTIYARWLTRQEQWEYDADVWWDNWLADNWDEDEQGEPPDNPDHPPEDYEPDWESTPAWTTCKKDAPEATKVFCCEPRA